MKRLIIPLLFLYLFSALSQENGKGISFKFEQQPLNEILDFLLSEYQLVMIYQDNQVADQLISTQCKDCNLEEALSCVLKNTSITWQKLNDQIVLYYRDNYDPMITHRKIYGQIVDAENQTPLPYANIILKGSKRGALSDTSGLFYFLDVAARKDTLQVHYIGYASKEILTSDLDENNIVKVELEESPLYTDHITVTGEKNKSFEISEEQAGKIKFSPLAMDFIPSTGQADFQRTMQLMPGVSAAQDKSSELRILGGDRSHNMIYLDGIPVVIKPELYFGMLNPFHSQTIEEVSIMKGGYPAQYGDCIGSVIELTGNTLRDKRFNFGVGIDIFQVNGFIQVPVSSRLKWFFAVNKSLKNIDDGPVYRDIYAVSQETHKIVENVDGIKIRDDTYPTEDYSFWRIMSKTSFTVSSKDDISCTFYSGNEKEFGKILYGPDLRYIDTWKWKNTGLSGQWSRQWNSKLTSTFSIVYKNDIRPVDYYEDIYSSDNTIVNGICIDFIKNELQNFILKNRTAINFNIVKLNIGGEISRKNIRYEYKRMHSGFYSDLPLEESENFYLGGKDEIYKNVFFMQSDWDVTKKINIGFGLRSVDYKIRGLKYDNDTLQGDYYKSSLNVLPRASFTISFLDEITLSGGWGRYSQYFYPMRDLGLGVITLRNRFSLWGYANKQLPILSADHTILKLSYNRSQYNLVIEAYYKKLRRIFLNKDYNLPHFLGYDNHPINPFFKGSGSAKGLQFSAQKLSGNLTGWLAYDYGKVSYQFPGLNNNKPFPPEYHRDHEFKVVACLSVGNWRFTTAGIYASPVSSLKDKIIYSDASSGSSFKTIFDFNLPAYQRIDLTISRLFKNFMYMDWQLGVSFLNVFNNKVVLDRYFQKISDLLELSSERRMLPFIPLVFLNVSYR